MNYIIGEKKYAGIRIKIVTGEPFYIKEASFELSRDGVVVLSDACKIDRQKQILYAYLAPADPGKYQLEYTYVIGIEEIKARYGVIVRC